MAALSTIGPLAETSFPTTLPLDIILQYPEQAPDILRPIGVNIWADFQNPDNKVVKYADHKAIYSDLSSRCINRTHVKGGHLEIPAHVVGRDGRTIIALTAQIYKDSQQVGRKIIESYFTTTSDDFILKVNRNCPEEGLLENLKIVLKAEPPFSREAETEGSLSRYYPIYVDGENRSVFDPIDPFGVAMTLKS